MFNYLGRNAKWIGLSYLLWGVGEGLWIYILAPYIAELGAGPEQVGLVIGVNWLIKVLVYVPAGWLADRFGGRRLMLPMWVTGTLGVLGVALSPDWRWLLPAFVVYGLSGAGVILSGTYITHVVTAEAAARPRQTYSRVITTLMAGYSAGMIVSPGVGGWLGERVGLRAVFFFSALWFVLSTFAASRSRSVPFTPRRGDVSGYGEMLRRRWLVSAMMAGGLAFALVAVVSPTGMAPPTFAGERLHIDAGTIGFFGSLNALSMALFSLWFGRGDRPMRAFLAAAALTWSGSALILLTDHAVGMGAAYMLLGSAAVLRPLLESAVLPHVRADQRGVLLALIGTVHALGTTAGSWAAGRLYADPGPEWPFLVTLIGFPLVGALCWLSLRPARLPETADPHPLPLSPTWREKESRAAPGTARRG